jgi:hypothetical protein
MVLHGTLASANAFKDSILIIAFLDVGRERSSGEIGPNRGEITTNTPETMQNSGTESADILGSADILSAAGRGTFCHPSSAQRLAGQYVRHPAARRMLALLHGAPACRSADILSAAGRGTFCHPSSAQRLAGQYVRHPAARRMLALLQASEASAP